MPYSSLLHPEPLPLWQSTAGLYLHRRLSNIVLSQPLWGLWTLVCTRFVWTLWASLVGMGFDSKYEFAHPTILLGVVLCPWTWGISSKLLQHCAAAVPVPTISLGHLWPSPQVGKYYNQVSFMELAHIIVVALQVSILQVGPVSWRPTESLMLQFNSKGSLETEFLLP